ncbi:uncharacterized protein [Palaemon carinicauda]|uniref:uncharacterized protein isoform X2 n=1 Tax=Palaemon carinicauda TaxID=392227 RepID=UPI0035B67980
MCLLRLCCDPHKLTYIAAIFTACEAVIFGILNFVLIMVATCIIEPPDSKLHAGLDKFYSWYYYTPNGSCTDRYGSNYTVPEWVTDDYPLKERPEETLPEVNFAYQIAYLVLHALWFVSALLLMYGNARKRWGYYLPWLTISLTFTFMDVAISAFFIKDMMEVFHLDRTETPIEAIQPMIWSFSMYLRAYVIWFMNLGHIGTVLNAFCKTYHKRSKEKRKRKKLQRKHERELAQARLSAAEEARQAIYNEEQAQIMQEPPNNHYSPEPTIQHEGVQNMPGIENDEYDPPSCSEIPSYVEPPRPPHKIPSEGRPFSYLNPGFRPSDPHDVIGMKKNPAPSIPESNSYRKEQSYFSAVPPTYNDDVSSEGKFLETPAPHRLGQRSTEIGLYKKNYLNFSK